MYILFESPIKNYKYKGQTIELYRTGWYVWYEYRADTLQGIKNFINQSKN